MIHALQSPSPTMTSRLSTPDHGVLALLLTTASVMVCGCSSRGSATGVTYLVGDCETSYNWDVRVPTLAAASALAENATEVDGVQSFEFHVCEGAEEEFPDPAVIGEDKYGAYADLPESHSILIRGVSSPTRVKNLSLELNSGAALIEGFEIEESLFIVMSGYGYDGCEPSSGSSAQCALILRELSFADADIVVDDSGWYTYSGKVILDGIQGERLMVDATSLEVVGEAVPGVAVQHLTLVTTSALLPTVGVCSLEHNDYNSIYSASRHGRAEIHIGKLFTPTEGCETPEVQLLRGARQSALDVTIDIAWFDNGGFYARYDGIPDGWQVGGAALMLHDFSSFDFRSGDLEEGEDLGAWSFDLQNGDWVNIEGLTQGEVTMDHVGFAQLEAVTLSASSGSPVTATNPGDLRILDSSLESMDAAALEVTWADPEQGFGVVRAESSTFAGGSEDIDVLLTSYTEGYEALQQQELNDPWTCMWADPLLSCF